LTEILRVSTRNTLYHTNGFVLKLNFLTLTNLDTHHYHHLLPLKNVWMILLAAY